MRKILATTCAALIVLSAPAFAQSSSPAVGQPSNPSPVVNSNNGLQALGQVTDNDQNGGGGGNNGLLIALGVAGGGGLAWALIEANKHKSVSP